MQSIKTKVIARIYGKSRGWVFTQTDFGDISSRDGIDTALKTLAKNGPIRRLARGLYDYPRFSELLQKELGPDIMKVAEALSRKFNWRIQPSGVTALNLMGISTQVPGRYLFISDGPNRSYKIDKTTIEFRRIALKESGLKHTESQIIVQGLKELGEKQTDELVIHQIREWLPAEKRQVVQKETLRVTAWVYEAIRKICREDENG
jgi:hypothetical protein